MAIETYTPFVEYIAKKMKMHPELEIVNINELSYELYNNHYDIGIFKPFPNLEAQSQFPELGLFATHQVFGFHIYSCGIIVKRTLDIEINKLNNEGSRSCISNGTFAEVH